MKRIAPFFTLIFLSFLFSGCATLLNTTTEEIEIKSTPSGARVTIDNRKFGLTPQIVNIERKKDHMIKLELEGYQTYETMVTTKISFWFWGNVCNGFVPGMIIDFFTGSMNTLVPDAVDAQLTVTPPKAADTKK